MPAAKVHVMLLICMLEITKEVESASPPVQYLEFEQTSFALFQQSAVASSFTGNVPALINSTAPYK